ncbi:hypothetical protein [Actinocorallia aurantiaca]|uniref:Uncharacterized protein n=1 Tax=Actinocorallia aurantiaca TaxID=46204 RepID=A0ABN3UNC9_9ACTN
MEIWQIISSGTFLAFLLMYARLYLNHRRDMKIAELALNGTHPADRPRIMDKLAKILLVLNKRREPDPSQFIGSQQPPQDPPPAV